MHHDPLKDIQASEKVAAKVIMIIGLLVILFAVWDQFGEIL